MALPRKVAKKFDNNPVVAPLGYDNFDEVLKDFIIEIDKDMTISPDENMVQYRGATAKWYRHGEEDKRITFTVRTFHDIKPIAETLMWATDANITDEEITFPAVVLGRVRDGKTTRYITAQSYNVALSIIEDIFDEK